MSLALIIPVVIFSILFALILYSKPLFFAKKEDGKKVIQWKRTIIFCLIWTIIATVLMFVFFPEVLIM